MLFRSETAAPGVVRACLEDMVRVSLDERVVLLSKSGARLDVEASASPVRKPSGEMIGVVLVFQDVTRARTLQKELTQLASHDALTGLRNRSAFEAALGDLCRSRPHDRRWRWASRQW